MSEPVIQSLVARRIWHFARAPDGRSGNHAERRRGGQRNCSCRRITRFPRGDRQARRRQSASAALTCRTRCKGSLQKSRRPSSASTRSIRPRSTRSSSLSTARRTRRGSGKCADRRFAWRSSCGGGQPRSSRSGVIVSATSRRSFRCRRSRSSAAAPMPGRRTDVQDFMVIAPRPKPSPRRWRSRRMSIIPQAGSWPSAASCRAWPTRRLVAGVFEQ